METYNKEIFASNLSYYMSRNGKEPKDICELLSVGKSTVSSWLNAKKVPRMDKIETLASYFGVLKSDLLEERPANQIMEFAQTLKRLMDERGITNYQLAKDLDVHPTTVANWLNGKEPRKKTKFQLAGYFGIDFMELYPTVSPDVRDVAREYFKIWPDSGEDEKAPTPDDEDGLTEKDMRVIKWFRSLPTETQRAILTLGDGPKDLAE